MSGIELVAAAEGACFVVSDAAVPNLLAVADLVAGGADAAEVVGNETRERKKAACSAGIDVGHGIGSLVGGVGAATGTLKLP
jgi:hypothetical protein